MLRERDKRRGASTVVLRGSRGADGFDCTSRCMHAPRIRSGARIGILCKNMNKKETTSDEISRRRLDGFAICLSARSSVSTPARHRIRALPSLYPTPSFLSFSPLSYQTYQFSVSIPPIPFIFFYFLLSFSFSIAKRIYLPRQRLHPTE